LRVVKHIMLWVISMILFTLAAFGLELLEGNKITTSEYYGFRNIGFVFMFMNLVLSFVLYPIVIVPLSWVVRKLANPLISRVMIVLLSGIGGYYLFHMAYDERFIEEYHLNSSVGIILYSIAGLIFVIVDYYLDRPER
jgi:hypothetical protein